MKSLREQKQKRLSSKKKLVLIIISSVIALLLIGGGGWYAWQQRTLANLQATDLPASEQAPAKSEAAKSEVVQPAPTEMPSSKDPEVPTSTTPTPSTPDQKQKVTPAISFAGYADNTKSQVEVDAYVPAIFEDGGTCTMTATQGSHKVTLQTKGQKNSSYTSCQNFLLDRSKFPVGGTWKVIVSYESTKAQGASQEKAVEL